MNLVIEKDWKKNQPPLPGAYENLTFSSIQLKKKITQQAYN